MNCKPGDLAVIVGCHPNQKYTLGHICTIIRRSDHPQTGEPGWHFEPPVRLTDNNCTLDAYLRPLRDQPGDDETLTWAGKPVLVAA